MALFTAANAAEMARRSHAPGSARLTAAPAPQTPETPAEGDAYVPSRLARVRKQIARIDAMIESETEPAKLDRLCAAGERLARQEAALAMRPGPGQLRPTAQRSAPRPVGEPTTMIFTLIYRGQRYYLNAEHLARLVMLLALNHNNQRKTKP